MKNQAVLRYEGEVYGEKSKPASGSRRLRSYGYHDAISTPVSLLAEVGSTQLSKVAEIGESSEAQLSGTVYQLQDNVFLSQDRGSVSLVQLEETTRRISRSVLLGQGVSVLDALMLDYQGERYPVLLIDDFLESDSPDPSECDCVERFGTKILAVFSSSGEFLFLTSSQASFYGTEEVSLRIEPSEPEVIILDRELGRSEKYRFELVPKVKVQSPPKFRSEDCPPMVKPGYPLEDIQVLHSHGTPHDCDGQGTIKPHIGFDLLATVGTKFFSTRAGRVEYENGDSLGYGLSVDDGSAKDFYLHVKPCQKIPGNFIAAGQPLGTVAHEVYSPPEQDHLHWVPGGDKVLPVSVGETKLWEVLFEDSQGKVLPEKIEGRVDVFATVIVDQLGFWVGPLGLKVAFPGENSRSLFDFTKKIILRSDTGKLIFDPQRPVPSKHRGGWVTYLTWHLTCDETWDTTSAPNGPAEIEFEVMDLAGNWQSLTYPVEIANP